VFDVVKKDVCAAIIKLIDMERENATVDRALIRFSMLLVPITNYFCHSEFWQKHFEIMITISEIV
jgi:hypothetical protein